MKRIALLLAALLLNAGCTSPAQTPSARPTERARLQPTRITSPNCLVHLRAKWNGDQGCVGTGAVIVDDRGHKSVLTAAHVINQGSELEVVFGGREGRTEQRVAKPFHECGVQYAQLGRDAARLTQIEIPDWVIPARIASRPPTNGEVVTAYGLYDPNALRIRQAPVVAGPPGQGERVYIGVTSEPGDSGSPIFNGKGEIVAVLEGWQNWWENKTQNRTQDGPWGTLIEVRTWNEELKATRGPRLHDAIFTGYQRRN